MKLNRIALTSTNRIDIFSVNEIMSRGKEWRQDEFHSIDFSTQFARSLLNVGREDLVIEVTRILKVRDLSQEQILSSPSLDEWIRMEYITKRVAVRIDETNNCVVGVTWGRDWNTVVFRLVYGLDNLFPDRVTIYELDSEGEIHHEYEEERGSFPRGYKKNLRRSECGSRLRLFNKEGIDYYLGIFLGKMMIPENIVDRSSGV
jgi:hypothetical protein